MRRDYRRLRPWVRRLFLVAAVLALCPLLSATSAAAFAGALSPFVAVGSAIAARALPGVAVVGCLVGLATLFRRRLFCRWICPAGLCLDGVGRLGRITGRRPARRGTLGQWLMWSTLGGACLGYPVFLWLDPMALFGSAFSIPRASGSPSAWVVPSMIAMLLVVSFWHPGIWCAQACPLGALQDSFYRLRLGVTRRFRDRRESSYDSPSGFRLTRRNWLAAGGGALAAAVVPRIASGSPPGVRPPNALPEPIFVGVCIRCGNCVRACPTDIVHNAGTQHGWLGVLAPTLRFDADYCREDCIRCTEVCPSGALTSLAPERKERVRIGRPRVNLDVCLLADDRECSHCRNRCPYEAITYVFSEERYMLYPQVDLDRCNGCGACETYCPTSPVKAILIEPWSQEG